MSDLTATQTNPHCPEPQRRTLSVTTVKLNLGWQDQRLAGKPVVRRIPLEGAKAAVGKLADELEGYEDLHASAELRRDILRNLAPVVIEEARACAA